MNEKLWQDALTGVEQKYIDRTVKSFRSGSASDRTKVIEAKFIDPPKDMPAEKPKSRAFRVLTATASAAAALALIAGGVFAVDYIAKNGQLVETPTAGQQGILAAERPDEGKPQIVAEEVEAPAPEFSVMREGRDILEAFRFHKNSPEQSRETAKSYLPDGKDEAGAGGCTESGSYFTAEISGDVTNITVRRHDDDADLSESYYTVSPEGSDILLQLYHQTRFFVTKDGPAMLVRTYDSKAGELDGAFLVFYDGDMNIINVSEVTLPDDKFFGKCELTYDGKYLIDEHWSQYLSSAPYIRIYSVDGGTTKLAFDLGIGDLSYEFPDEDGAFTIDGVLSCTMSRDGETLIAAVSIRYTNGDSSIGRLAKNLKTGALTLEKAMTGPIYAVAAKSYDGGIATFFIGVVNIMDENGRTMYIFEDGDIDVDCYSISPNGEYVRALKTRTEGGRYIYEFRSYKLSEAEEINGSLWLTLKNAKIDKMELSQPIEGSILFEINNDGNVFEVWARGKGGAGSGAFNYDFKSYTSSELEEADENSLFSTESEYPDESDYPEPPDDMDGEPLSQTEAEHKDPENTATDGMFMFPVTDETAFVNVYFGEYSGHDGIDIASDNGEGTPIYASADGVVTLAEQDLSGYGKYVIIDHGNGYQTLYGHCSELYVEAGREVARGERIADIGSTGFSTGSHLHFEIIKDEERVDPMNYLQ